MGPVSAVAPLAAQAFGARKPALVRRCAARRAVGRVVIGIPVNVAQLWGEDILIAAGQAPETAALAARYLGWLDVVDDPRLVLHRAPQFHGRGQSSGAGAVRSRSRPSRSTACSPTRLIHGAFGLPRLDLLGAGLATTLVNVAMCVAAIWVCYARRPFQKYRVLGRFWRAGLAADAQAVRDRMRRSPARFMLEWGLFSSAALLVGWIGTTALAAHQIALAGRGHPVHDSVRHLACRDRAGRARGRPPRSGGGAQGRLRRAGVGRGLHDRDDGDHRRASP